MNPRKRPARCRRSPYSPPTRGWTEGGEHRRASNGGFPIEAITADTADDAGSL